MLTIDKPIPGGRLPAPVLIQRAPRVWLDHDRRQKSRFATTGSQGGRPGAPPHDPSHDH